MKFGLYQTMTPHLVLEKHGGGRIKHKIYWNLCFYSDMTVGLFGGDKDYLEPYIRRNFDLKGEIIRLTDDHLELYITNPYTQIRKIYKGKILPDTLHLKYYMEDKPNDVSEDVFQYIDTEQA